ncbi:hypothetical protein ACH427_16845 [Streptomyces sp. NPDC020379]|uniref:hypothetical protein n=1 Tax=Streptomyces sp. NPDC020379 TaxID=3365071 RepID=UPI003787CC41
MYCDPRPHEAPPLIEAIAVWGWAVEHGGIPLDYAAGILADHDCYVEYSGVPDPTENERRTWAAEDLANWEDVIVRMDWPGDDAIDEERWDQGADWKLREYLLRCHGLDESPENTEELLLRHCREQIAECERQLADQTDTRTDEGN